MTEIQNTILQNFLDTNPNEFDLCNAALKLFQYKKEVIGDFRRTEFLLPDTQYCTYNYGVRVCYISTSNWGGFNVRVSYSTIDDASMGAEIYFQNEDQMNRAYDILVKELHLDYKNRPVGFSYVMTDTQSIDGFEQGFREYCESILPGLNYFIKFDYN